MTPELKARLEELSHVRPTNRRTIQLNVRGMTPLDGEEYAPIAEAVPYVRVDGERSRPNRLLTIEQEQELASMTIGDREIAALFGVSTNTVYRTRLKLGVKKGPNTEKAKRTVERQAAQKEAKARLALEEKAAQDAARLKRNRAIFEAHGTPEEVAARFGVSKGKVYTVWREGGRPTSSKRASNPKPA